MTDFMIHFLICNVLISGLIGILFAVRKLLKNHLTGRTRYSLWFLLSGLLRASALNYVSLILLIWMYYRMFSKNIRKRCEEERMYMDTKEKVIRFCKGDKSVISDSKTHKIYRCPHCRQKIRVPRGKGKIEITCPSCRSKFIKRT